MLERETMKQSDFELRALYDALDAQRRARQMSWAEVAKEVNQRRTRRRPVAVSTMIGLKENSAGEGDGILQMLVWLRRTPESFMSGVADPHSDVFCRPQLKAGEIMRWDPEALHSALDARRRSRQRTWAAVASEVGVTPGMLRNLAKGGRVGFPGVMRVVRWLDQPAAAFTRVAAW
jgi:hypothetical protein